MDRNFRSALSEVLKHEGGWADNPRDPGGATMKGVTLSSFRNYIKSNASKADLRALTDEQAGIIYRRHYWDAVLGAELPDGVDHALFDFAVNSGPSRAVKMLQKIVGTEQDGRIGPKTLAAIRKMDPEKLINRLSDERLAYMKRIKNSKTGARLWPTFGKGWQRRVEEVRRKSLAMAKEK